MQAQNKYDCKQILMAIKIISSIVVIALNVINKTAEAMLVAACPEKN
jgi:hypothetical protein